MKLLVCGSRTIKDIDYIFNCIDDTTEEFKIVITELIEGEADGVDKISRQYAEDQGISVNPKKPEWNKYGKGAGKVRNKEMVELCEGGIAIWDGRSMGTAHTISLLKKANKLLKVYKKDIFQIRLHGLSEDMMDFIFEKEIYYEEKKTKFWTSFYHTCSEMVQNLIDLSEKQLNIIYREYKKEKR